MQQVFIELLQVDGFVEDALFGSHWVGGFTGCEVDFEFGADSGEWAAKFVGCVGDEALLSADGTLEPVEGFVHGAGEAVDFVTGGWFGDSASGVGTGDLCKLSAHLFDWS